MTPVKVVVVFYSRYGGTEQRALAAGLGAIQAHGVIRLRRLADLADEAAIAGDPRWTAERERMSRDYVSPRPADAEWADAILVASPGDAPAEMEHYLGTLGGLRAKATALPDSAGDPTAFGRQATEAARQRKS